MMLTPYKCGHHAVYYKRSPENQTGKYGFYTHDLLKEFCPEMHSNDKIIVPLEKGAYPAYSAVNYAFSFQSEEVKSFCKPASYYANLEYNKNFFINVCPNLIYDYGGTAVIKAKLTKPLTFVNSVGEMIGKDADNTNVAYGSLLHYLKLNGKIKDCTGSSKCEDFKKIMEKVAWYTDKEVALKISDNAGKTSTYS